MSSTHALARRLLLVVLSLSPLWASAQDAGKPRDPFRAPGSEASQTPASEEKNLLRQGVLAAEKAYLNSVTSAQQDREGEARQELLWKAFVQTNDASIPRLMELAQRDPASAAAFQKLAFIVVNRRIHSRAFWPHALRAV